jgi:uncharacterized protein
MMPSISSPIPGMPKGKRAGEPCIHLSKEMRCTIYDSPFRPLVCKDFKADPLVCGNSRTEALTIFAELEGIEVLPQHNG